MAVAVGQFEAVSVGGVNVPFAELAMHLEGTVLLTLAPHESGTWPLRRAVAVRNEAYAKGEVKAGPENTGQNRRITYTMSGSELKAEFRHCASTALLEIHREACTFESRSSSRRHTS